MNNVKVKFDNEKIGMGYKQHFITKESLIEKNGNFWFKCVNDNTCDDWIDSINEYNHKMYIENFDNIPIGLEKKISLHWFSYFFNWNKMDTYKVDNFHGNWLDVPFPYKSGIKLFSDFDNEHIIPLKDPCYNWYELFILIDELMWNQGRVIDIGVTSIGLDKENPDIIEVGFST